MGLFIDADGDIRQAPATRNFRQPLYAPAEVETRSSRRGQPALNLYRFHRAHVTGFPNRIFRTKTPLDVRCLRLQ